MSAKHTDRICIRCTPEARKQVEAIQKMLGTKNLSRTIEALIGIAATSFNK